MNKGRYSLITPFSRLASLLICLRVRSCRGASRSWASMAWANRSTAAFSQDLHRSWEPEKVLLSPGLIHCTIFCAAVILTGGANLNFCNPQPQTPPTPETACVFFSKGFSAVLLRKSLHPKKGGGGSEGKKKTSVWLCPGDCFYSCNILKSRGKKLFFQACLPIFFIFYILLCDGHNFLPLLSFNHCWPKKKKKKKRGKINLRNCDWNLT